MANIETDIIMSKEDIFPNPEYVIKYGDIDNMEEKSDVEYGVRKTLLPNIHSGKKTGDEIFSRDIFQETLWKHKNVPTFNKVIFLICTNSM